jgi:hypothetical protein
MSQIEAAAPDAAAAGPEASNPEAEAAIAVTMARVRRMMIISGLTTLIAIAAVIGVIGYRVYRGGAAAAPSVEAVVLLPKGARVISTATAEDRIIITLDVAGATEVRTFDARTLKEAGRIRFATEP